VANLGLKQPKKLENMLKKIGKKSHQIWIDEIFISTKFMANLAVSRQL